MRHVIWTPERLPRGHPQAAERTGHPTTFLQTSTCNDPYRYFLKRLDLQAFGACTRFKSKMDLMSTPNLKKHLQMPQSRGPWSRGWHSQQEKVTQEREGKGEQKEKVQSGWCVGT